MTYNALFLWLNCRPYYFNINHICYINENSCNLAKLNLRAWQFLLSNGGKDKRHMMPYRWTDKSRTTVLHRSRAESFEMLIRYLEYFWIMRYTWFYIVFLCVRMHLGVFVYMFVFFGVSCCLCTFEYVLVFVSIKWKQAVHFYY